MENLSREETVDLAKWYAEKGFLCSEAVLLATCALLGIENDIIPQIATGFGAGIGRHGSVCGAVSGAIISLGLRFGRKTPETQQATNGKRPYWYASEFLSKFMESRKSYSCNNLTGCDISKPEGLAKYRKENHWETTCRDLIGEATSLVYDMLANNEEV
ncbi:MAG: C-GCAxxG-C-C family protein [Candidatus Thorarchaeota archaeon]